MQSDALVETFPAWLTQADVNATHPHILAYTATVEYGYSGIDPITN